VPAAANQFFRRSNYAQATTQPFLTVKKAGTRMTYFRTKTPEFVVAFLKNCALYCGLARGATPGAPEQV